MKRVSALTPITNLSVCTGVPAMNTWATCSDRRVSFLNGGRAIGLGSGGQFRCFGGGDERAIQNSIRAIESIEKVTKAMKTVAGAKLSKAKRMREQATPFSTATKSIIDRLPVDQMKGDTNRTLLFCVSTDKGLCGGLNSAVSKIARHEIVKREAAGEEVLIFGFGVKIRDAMKRLFGDRFYRMIYHATNPFNFGVACSMAERLYASDASRILLLYNHYKNALAFEALNVPLLPLKFTSNVDMSGLNGFEFEPERADSWSDLHEFYFASTLFGAILDNVCSEQSSRVAAMDNASKSARDMITSLMLKKNKARQARITMELIEIISGGNAV